VVTDNASNMCSSFTVAKEFQDEDDESVVEFPSVDVETVWNDLDNGDAFHTEINNVIQCRSLLRFSCFAHSLQLTVKDGLKANTSKLVLTKCSKLASMVHQSAQFRESFARKFGHLGISLSLYIVYVFSFVQVTDICNLFVILRMCEL